LGIKNKTRHATKKFEAQGLIKLDANFSEYLEAGLLFI
jgi:hypothetical protein